MAELEERTVTISGVKVVFPCKPYPSQFGMMDRVIKGLEKSQNCLLESPTGSGKSLALLCSALAWQVAYQEKITRDNLVETSTDTGDCCKQCTCGANKSKLPTEYSPESKPICIDTEEEKVGPVVIDCDDDDDFKPSSFQKKTPRPDPSTKRRKHVGIRYEDDVESTDTPVKCTCSASACTDYTNMGNNTVKKQKLPKIYFGTRTHKQIAQITRELRKTAYHDVRMTILASREYTCVHPDVTKLKNKNEGCKERLDRTGPGCKFNDKSKRVFLSQNQLQDELPTAWDLEDLVGSCKKQKACPYFVTKNIREGADIVFCPYNYLIDPLVRKSMEINLKGQIVILDEAHNIEDSARDAAGGSVTTEQIASAIQNLQQLLDVNVKFVQHLKLKTMLESLLTFVESNNSNLDQQDYNTAYKVWSGFDIVARLKNIGLGPDRIQEYRRSFELATQTEEDQVSMRDRRNQVIKLSSSSTQILELLFQILDYMYRDDLKFVEDYRVAIMKSVQFVSNRQAGDGWLGKNRRGGMQMTVFTLNFWCMNPAVAFSDFSDCRNVVLSSGTLSPMSSFQSELGVPFPIQLEANHIIEDKQVWVGAIGVGPSGNQLQAVYRNMETFMFQDELGQLVCQVCMKVPHGVLCFLPSYRALQKFVERWKLTGLWNKLTSRKRVMIEPRAANREDFDGMMKAFYEVVKGDLNSSHLSEEDCSDDDSDIDGALFFAVCRGKVSEGMDFADNNARAVITVGIPFPSIKDVQVKLKREYNDRHRMSRGLLSGNDWYEIQAFRALNQALGRCIRHRKDWGALIIVDDRFVKNTPKYTKSLSRWVRSKVQTYSTFPSFIDSMSSFNEKMVKEMPVINADTSFIPCTPGDNRRDSIYSRQSMDNSYMDTSLQASPYFRSPPLSQHKTVIRTPDSTNKRLSLDNKGSNSVPNSPLITSPSIQQQIMDIVNSTTSPKDQPYYVVLNQGLPNEQAYLIQPNNTTLMNPVLAPSQQLMLLPSTLVDQKPLPEAGQQLHVTLNAAGSCPSQQLMTQQPLLQQLVSGLQNKQILTQTAGLGTSLLQEKGNTNKNQTVTNSEQENSSTGMKKGEIIFTLGSSSLSVEEQLKGFISSGQAPKDRPYYVVIGKGEPTERAFFIDPNKKGKSGKFHIKKEEEASADCKSSDKPAPSSTAEVTATEDPPGSSVPSNVVAVRKCDQVTVDQGTSCEEDSTAHNKYLKFCHIPTKPTSKVPVATVTPQRPGNITAEEVKKEDDEQKVNEISNQSELNKIPMSRPSPILFDEPSADSVEDIAKFKSNAERDFAKVSSKKKPIFKKRNSLPEAKEETEENKEIGNRPKTALRCIKNVKTEAKENERGENLAEANVDIETKDSDFEEKKKSGKRRTSLRGTIDKVIVDKVKKGRQVESDKTNDSVLETDNANKAELSGNDVYSDDEFLNTRRRGGRKRKSTSKYSEWSKRSKKGIVYDDDDEDKENVESPTKCISCMKCQAVWLKSVKLEKQSETPDFLRKTSKKNSEVLLLEISNIDISSLSTLSEDSSVKGVVLNSTYTNGCCIQYVQCKTCNTDHLVGARVLLADSTSMYKPGQLWILSSAVKVKT